MSEQKMSMGRTCRCVCAARWKEALDAGCAPQVVLRATHESVLGLMDMQTLKQYAIDLT